jgi:hypothetical protein
MQAGRPPNPSMRACTPLLRFATHERYARRWHCQIPQTQPRYHCSKALVAADITTRPILFLSILHTSPWTDPQNFQPVRTINQVDKRAEKIIALNCSWYSILLLYYIIPVCVCVLLFFLRNVLFLSKDAALADTELVRSCSIFSLVPYGLLAARVLVPVRARA